MASMLPAAVLLDVDGVLVVSWKPVLGAVEALHTLRRAGVRLRFLTNTTSRTRAQVASALWEAGFALEEAELFTAGVATAAYLAEHHAGARCLVENEGPLDDLTGVTLAGAGEQPDVVVIGSAGPRFSWEMMNRTAWPSGEMKFSMPRLKSLLSKISGGR